MLNILYQFIIQISTNCITIRGSLSLQGRHTLPPMSDMRDIFGENVRRQRKARGWTQEHLAELAGVSRAHLAILETAKVWPSIDMVEKVSAALDVPAARLFFAQAALTDEELATAVLDRLGYEPVLVPKKKRARG